MQTSAFFLLVCVASSVIGAEPRSWTQSRTTDFVIPAVIGAQNPSERMAGVIKVISQE